MKPALLPFRPNPLLKSLGFLVGLYLVYNIALALTPWSTLESIQGIHAVIACLILYRVRNDPSPDRSRGELPIARHLGLTKNALAYVPALLVGVSIVALFVWQGIPPDFSTIIGSKAFFFMVAIVPFLEEIVFRLGVFRLLLGNLSPTAKVTYSALVFACAHGRIWDQWFIPTAGLPMGPLFLGLASGAVFGLSGRLMPAILLHAVCNATGFLYPLVMNDEQFSWLRWLYG